MSRFVCAALVGLWLAPAGLAAAQDRPATDVTYTPVRVQVVFSRFDGEKKTSSMPYSLWVNVSSDPKQGNSANVRAGVMVPVHVLAGPNLTPTVAYKDVGSHVVCNVTPQADGRYLLQFEISQDAMAEPGPGAGRDGAPGNPIIRMFSNTFSMVLRDGQAAQATSGVDPVSGEVVKVDVSLSVVK